MTACFVSLHLSLAKSFSSIMAAHVFSAGNGVTEYLNFHQNKLTLPPMHLIVPMLDREAVHCFINMAVKHQLTIASL